MIFLFVLQKQNFTYISLSSGLLQHFHTMFFPQDAIYFA